MLEKYEEIKKEYDKLTQEISKTVVISDPKKYRKINKRLSKLKDLIKKFEELKKIQKNLEESEHILKVETDPEFIAVAEDETRKLKEQKEKLVKKLELELLPKDPSDEKNIIMEIRAGTGGEEAALFAADLFRMYSRYAEDKKWQVNIMNSNRTGSGGMKEVIFEIKGEDIYGNLKYESGVHRVQRVPKTESSGRIHTSAATVAVLPEAEEVDFKINPSDLKIDVFKSSGPGGQSVNTTDSAVRITHAPTGTVVACQDERSQIKNREKALSILRSRLLAQKEEEERKKRGEERKMQVGTGDRSEKIRTYNFPQDRITDHRINFTVHNMEEVLNGKIDSIIKRLKEEDKKRALEKIEKR